MRIEKKRGDAEQEEDCGRNVLQTEIIIRGASAFNHDIKHLRLLWRPALKTAILFFFFLTRLRSDLPFCTKTTYSSLQPPTLTPPLVYVYVPSDNLTRRSSRFTEASFKMYTPWTVQPYDQHSRLLPHGRSEAREEEGGSVYRGCNRGSRAKRELAQRNRRWTFEKRFIFLGCCAISHEDYVQADPDCIDDNGERQRRIEQTRSLI